MSRRHLRPFFRPLLALGVAVALLAATPGISSEAAEPAARTAAEAGSGSDAATERLLDLSEAFGHVARTVQPSVVQVSVKVQPSARRQVPGGGFRYHFGPGSDPEEFFREFRRFFDELPEEGGPFGETPSEPRPEKNGGDGEDDGEQRKSEDEGEEGDYEVPMRVGAASGWVYDAEGHVVTNHHVVAKADAITLRFHDGTEAEAEVVGSDPQTDIAVLKTDKAGIRPAGLATESVRQGDVVMAIGSPFEYAFSVSQGIVSARGRRMGILGPQGYENFIQTDAAINPGNSGGPLVNAKGEVVGMNTAIATRTGTFAGIGFAIPADMIRDVVDQLIRTGKVRRGYLGAYISDDPKMLESFGAEQGVLIEDVMDDTPADRAGLKSGDVILEFDGQAVASARKLRRMVAAAAPDTTVSLTILRDGNRQSVDVRLEEQPQSAAVPPRIGRAEGEPADRHQVFDKLGLEQLETVAPERAGEEEGVRVLEVRRYSAAAAAGIRPGTIITRVMGEEVTSVEQLAGALQKHDLEQGVRVRIETPDGRSRFTLLSLSE